MNKKGFEPGLTTLEDVNATLLNIAALTHSADKKESELNQKILSVTKNFEPDIKELRDKIADYEDQVINFCKRNKKLFIEKRSANLTYGVIGVRSGKSALRLINPKKFTWEFVKDKLQSLYSLKYVKVKFTIEKKKVVEAVDKGIIKPEELEQIGAKVSRKEEFYYKINWAEIKIEDSPKN